MGHPQPICGNTVTASAKRVSTVTRRRLAPDSCGIAAALGSRITHIAKGLREAQGARRSQPKLVPQFTLAKFSRNTSRPVLTQCTVFEDDKSDHDEVERREDE